MSMVRCLSKTSRGAAGRGPGAARAAAGRTGAALAVAKPQLTSLVDALTILLVFLLKSFSADGELVTPSCDLVLPTSTSRERPLPTVSIEIAAGRICVDGDPLPPSGAATDSLMIPALAERLQAITRATGTADRPHEVTIQCDRRVSFAVVKQVMHTCARSGYGDFGLLAFQEAS